MKLIEHSCGTSLINFKNLQVVEELLLRTFEDSYDDVTDTQGQNFILLLEEINIQVAKLLGFSYPSAEFLQHFSLQAKYAEYLESLCTAEAPKMSLVIYNRFKPTREFLWKILVESQTRPA